MCGMRCKKCGLDPLEEYFKEKNKVKALKEQISKVGLYIKEQWGYIEIAEKTGQDVETQKKFRNLIKEINEEITQILGEKKVIITLEVLQADENDYIKRTKVGDEIVVVDLKHATVDEALKRIILDLRDKAVDKR